MSTRSLRPLIVPRAARRSRATLTDPRADWWRERLADGLARDLAREVETILVASGGADHARHAPVPGIFGWLNEGILRDLEQMRELGDLVRRLGGTDRDRPERVESVHDVADLLDRLVDACDRAASDYLDRATLAERCGERSLADRFAAMAEDERIHAARGRDLRGRLPAAA